jgi:integrase
MAESTGKARRRANGEGSTYRTAEGRWRGAVAWTDVQGERRRKVVSGRTQAEVRRAIAEARVGLDRGLAPASPSTVAAFLAGWLEASKPRIRTSTWRGYAQCVRLYIVPAIGRRELAKLTPSDVEAMTAGMMKSGRSPRTAALTRVILRRALQDAQRDELVHRNAAALARPPRVPTRALRVGHDYLEPEQLRKLVDVARIHPLGPLVTLAALTGLRQGEVLGLTWGDVDLEAGTLTVRRSMARTWNAAGADVRALAEPKTARSRRSIDLPRTAIAALERRRGVQAVHRERAGAAWQDRDQLVFTDEVGRPLSPHAVTGHAPKPGQGASGFHELLEAAGLPHIPFHGLRHSAATALLAAGVPIKVVSEQLGHSTITITADRYAGVVPSQRREASEAMERAIGGAS